MRVILKNFRIIDEENDFFGSVILQNGIITRILSGSGLIEDNDAAIIINGKNLIAVGEKDLPILMPAFVDLHAHFRDPGYPEKETAFPSELLESACLAAAAGGFGTVVCMANTNPVTDTIEKVNAIKERSDNLGLIDLYPVMSLTKGMEGKELSKFADGPIMLSEDGKDLANDDLFLAAMKEAKRLNIPISCHCDFGGPQAEVSKKAGQARKIWSRIEENNAVERVFKLGKQAGCHIHIAHVSTKEAVEMIRTTKAALAKVNTDNGFTLTCEAMPHNFCLTEEDAAKLGDESFGRVNPPLRSEEDRKALIEALCDNTIDAIATDHAPHSQADKEKGAPGFSGLETAFAAAFTELVQNNKHINLSALSSLMSAKPARLLEKDDGCLFRGLIKEGYRADLVIVDTNVSWTVDPAKLKTRGKNSPFIGRQLFGKVLITIHKGRIVYEGDLS